MKDSSLIADTMEYLHELGVVPELDAGFDPAAYKGPVKIIQYDTYEDLANALEWGEVDAMVGDRSIVMGYLTADRVALPGEFAVQEYAAATGKQSGLFSDLSKAMADRLADGTVDMLIAKWGN